MKFITNITNFSAGLMSEKLHGRTDIREYSNGLSTAKNALVAKQGGGYKRFGLQNFMQLPDGNVTQIESVTLFSTTTVFLVFTPGRITLLNEKGYRIYADIGVPVTLGRFTAASYNDYIIITNYDGIRPIVIQMEQGFIGQVKVKSLTPWSDGFLNRPMSNPNTDKSKKIRANNVGNPTGATAIQSQGFNLQDEFFVGDAIMITGIANVENGTRIATNMYLINSFVSPTVANVTAFNFYNGTPYPRGVYDALANINLDTGSFPSGPDYTALDTVSFFFDEWSHSLWSDQRGWPRTVAVDEGRLIFGGNRTKPATIWGSMVGNPLHFLDRRLTNTQGFWTDGAGNGRTFRFHGSFDGDIQVTDPYQFTLASESGSEITFMEASVSFVVGTTRQEFIISGNGEIISPKNITARPHTSHGSARNISFVYDNTVVFVGRSRQQIYMLRYSEDNGSFVSKELTILNNDFLEDDYVKSMEWHEELGVAFIVTDNGNLLCLTLNNESQTTAFTKIETNGTVVDCAYNVDNEQDSITMLVRRNDLFFLEALTRAELYFIGITATQLFSIRDRFNFMDNNLLFADTFTVQPIIQNTIRWISQVGDYINFNYASIKVGDRITFSSPNPNVFSGQVNLTLGIEYYVIPFKTSSQVGFRVATNLANAQAGIFLGLANQTFDNGDLLFYTLVRDNQVIPTGRFANGTTVTVFAEPLNPLDDPVEFTFTADGTDTYDLGAAYPSVVVGETYEFHIETMPLDAGNQWGSAQLGLKRVDKAGIRFYQTRSFRISTDGYDYEEISYDEPTTGRKNLTLQGTPEEDHTIHIQNDKAEACYISSMALRGLSNDG